MKNYLPSKNFVKIFLILVILTFVITITTLFIKGKKRIKEENKIKETLAGLTIGDLIEQDTDKDGVFDWEEALWGTDPNNQKTFDDKKDSLWINDKKVSLNMSTESLDYSSTDNKTDQFAKEFFATYTALKQTGELNPDSMKNISEIVSQKITDTTLTNNFTDSDLILSQVDDKMSQEKYYAEIVKIINDPKNDLLGTELMVLSENFNNNQNQNEPILELENISLLYTDLVEDFRKIEVPQSLSKYHLDFINLYTGIGLATKNLAKTFIDPVSGIGGLAKYNKYNDDLSDSVDGLINYLESNDII